MAFLFYVILIYYSVYGGHMIITEERFRKGLGTQFLADGMTVRCQGTSKNQVRRWREENHDYDTPTEDLWPDCQCTRAAVPGAFACKWHGGITKSKNPPRSMLDVLPIDLAGKFKTLVDNPGYISRRDEIALIQARNWELMEELDQETGSEESWGLVTEALVQLKRGNHIVAHEILQNALKGVSKQASIWQEIRANSLVLKDLTNTQIRTAEKLQAMATVEQVSALIKNILGAITDGAAKYIDDTGTRNQFLYDIARRVAGLTNSGAITTISGISRDSAEVYGDSERMD